MKATGAAGHGTREALAAGLQHVGTGKLEGMGRCASKFAEQRYKQSEVAQNMHQTFQAGSGEQVLQHTGHKNSADTSGLTVCMGRMLWFSDTKRTEIVGFVQGSWRCRCFGADHSKLGH